MSSNESSTEVLSVEVEKLYVHSWGDNVFKHNFFFAWSKDRSRIEEFIQRNQSDPNYKTSIGDGRVEYHQTRCGSGYVTIISLHVVWTPDEIDDSFFDILILLSHECNHAAFSLFKHRGIPLPKNGNPKNNDEEAFCYYAEAIYRECIDALREPEKYVWNFTEEEKININYVPRNSI